jgi:hypothetical protein
LQGGTPLARRGVEVSLRHREEERDAEPEGQGAAYQERQVQGDGSKETLPTTPRSEPA